MYSPTVGTFLQRDPIGYLAGDPNLGRYVGNRPVNALDPYGTSSGSPDKNPQHDPKDINIFHRGSCEGCIILFYAGRGGAANDTTSSLYRAAQDSLSKGAGRHLLATVTTTADNEIRNRMSREVDARCCCWATKNKKTKTVCVVLVGHSHGAHEAVKMADWLADEVKQQCPSKSLAISLITIDAIKQPGTGALTAGPKTKLKKFLNFFQTTDGSSGTIGDEINGATNKNVSDELFDWITTSGTLRGRTSGHKAIDDYLQAQPVIEGKTLGQWVRGEADRLEGC